jgi:hypothetical protein
MRVMLTIKNPFKSKNTKGEKMKRILSVFIFSSMSLFLIADDTTIEKKPDLNKDIAKTSSVKLKEGDIVALCGDSITSNGAYPQFIEIYQLVCASSPQVTLKNFGRWGETAAAFPPIMDKDVIPSKPTVATICYGMNNCRSSKVMSEEQAKAWGAGEILTVVKKFKDAGVRQIFLGSPGCVDSEHFTLSQSAPPNPKAIEATNKNLSMLRDSAEKIAKENNIIFVDVHKPMIEVMAKAKEKYGKAYAFAGGGGDGVHPGQAGHLVMAWAFLKAFGYSGEIGTITIDFAKDTATATEGHSIAGCKGRIINIESTRYPFCFSGDPAKPGSNSTRSVAELFSFNNDLNKYMLTVKDAPEKTKITWGSKSKEFDSSTLAKGINLAAEFMDNPFSSSFAKIFTALNERNQCRGWLRNEFKNDPGMQKRLDAAIAATVPVPVKHEIKIEAIK